MQKKWEKELMKTGGGMRRINGEERRRQENEGVKRGEEGRGMRGENRCGTPSLTKVLIF